MTQVYAQTSVAEQTNKKRLLIMITEGLHIRQTGIIDPAKLTHKIAIIGAGSIGGWTALCLGKLGCQDITVFDFDTVELHNAGSQVFKASDEDMLKTEALQNRLTFLLEEDIKTINTRWTPEVDLSKFDIVIAAVDSITPRAQIFEHLRSGRSTAKDVFYIDPRMAGNAIEIYQIQLPNVTSDIQTYESSLFDEKDALPIACSERSVVYNVFVIAGLIGDLVAKYANGEELPRELVMDLRNFTLYK